MDVTADLEGSYFRKGLDNIFARIFLFAIKAKSLPVGINLVDEFVIVGEGEAFAAVDRDLAGMKGASFLDDGMGFVGT